ncbi:MAG: hypothetical protein KIT14_11230 [bacterium]|nr:hypothetical protein [bacterium]
MLEGAELARRRAVWEALADLFLDTETRWQLPAIAAVLVESGYAPEELERIWRRELLPELGGNVLQAAGEWAALALDEDRLAVRAAGHTSLGERLVAWLAGRVLRRTWHALGTLRARLAALEPAARDARVALWSGLARLYFERTDAPDPLGWQEGLYRSGFDRAGCHAAFTHDVEPIFAALLVGGERAFEAARAARVRAGIAWAFG